jgi:hypothetical protein
MLQSHRLHAEAGHCETGFQRHIDAVAVYREPQELQARRAVCQ